MGHFMNLLIVVLFLMGGLIYTHEEPLSRFFVLILTGFYASVILYHNIKRIGTIYGEFEAVEI